ncbi:MAG: trypsin-like peptidase domain-containing protein, partial [Cyanobacteria bacterium P01_A01_bin.83]
KYIKYILIFLTIFVTVVGCSFTSTADIAKNITVKITGYNNGSGVIFKHQGNIYSVVTNQHVVAGNEEYEVRTPDGKKHEVISKQEIAGLDLAIVQFESSDKYKIAKIGNSDNLHPSQRVYVGGFPGEQTDLDFIDGTIRSINTEVLKNPELAAGYALIYTNQTLPGSSGGAVLDGKGRLIAINGEGETEIKTGRNISRGIPINLFLEANNYQLAYTTPNGVNHDGKVNAVATSDNYYISGGEDKIIKVWNLATGELERNLISHSDQVNTMAVSGDKLVSGSWDKTIKVWNLTTGELERTLIGHSGAILSLSLNGNKIVSGSNDKTIKVWNLNTGELERTFFDNDSNSVFSVAIDGNYIVSGNWSVLGSNGKDTIKVWNLKTGKLERIILSNHSDIVLSVTVNEDQIISAGADNNIKVWNLATGTLKHTLSGHSGSVYSLMVNGNNIFSGSSDNTIKVWNLATGELESTLSGHSDSVSSLAVRGDKIISGSEDNTIKVWQLQK